MFLIEILKLDPLENKLENAAYHKILGYVTSKKEADRFEKEKIHYSTCAWPLLYMPKDDNGMVNAYRVTKIEELI